ncbi:MAG: IPT/TIG domain-containing protein [Limisphaerales bacterium]
MSLVRFRIAFVVLGLLLLTSLTARAQTITSISPTFGEPGTEVTISGSGFSQTDNVFFGNIQAATLSINFNQIRAIVPVNAVTAVIQIQPAFGFPTQSPTQFEVAPRVDSFHRNGALGVTVVATGGQLQINGANFLFNNFQSIAEVKIGDIIVPNVTAPASSIIFLTVPNNASSGPLTLTTPAGRFVTTSNLVISDTVIITGFTPHVGDAGTQVTISGGDFTAASSVTFNGVSANFAVTAADQILATAPSTNFGTGPIAVTTPTGTATTSSNFVDTGGVPFISGFSPENGRAGDPVVIEGHNLLGVTNVLFNGISAGFTPTSSTQIGTVVPAGVTSGPITLESTGGSTISTNSFGVEPLITSFTPLAGEVGDQILIEGQNLGEVHTILFGTNAAVFTNTGPGQIHALVPFGATNGPISALAPAGTNVTATPFTVTFGEPLITGFSPSNGLPGNIIIVTGFNFFGATNVTIGNASAVFGVTADNQISLALPNSSGNSPITVFGPGGTNQSTNLFFYSPILTGYSPVKASVGTLLTIQGTNLAGATSVEFISTNQSKIPGEFTVIHDGQIQATVPTNVAHGPVTITTPGGIIITTTEFTVLPRIDIFTPLWGLRGDQVTLSGQSLEIIAQVQVNGVAADYFPDSATSIRLDIPQAATTGPISLVTTSGDTVSSATNLVVTMDTDLAITQTLLPPVVYGGETFNVLISITNKGPSIATQVQLTTTFDPQFSINSVTSAVGTASFNGQVVTCNLVSLTNGTSVQVTVEATANVFGGYDIVSGVSAAQGEVFRFDNNQSSLMRAIRVGEDVLFVTKLAGTNAVELRWNASAAAFQVQASTNLLSSGTQWQLLTDQIFLINSNGLFFNVLTNEIGTSRRSYRLFRD